MKTTEQLVRECFCYLCRQPIHSCISKCQLQNKLARAARHFVKAEQREKLHNRIRRQFKGKCKIVVEKGGYNLQAALKRAEERERKRR
jgi:hypothetical protein